MRKSVALTIALAALLGSGVLHGLYAERWAESDALRDAVARVPDVPHRIGDWTGKDLETDPVEFERAGARGHWMRHYTHARTGQTMLVILMAGRAGKMAVHTPEVCYRGAGYELMGAPTATPVRSDLGEPFGNLWTARFAKQSGRSSDLRLLWGWSPGTAWEAADNPRWQFRGAPFLYKLYVSQETAGTSAGGAPDGDPGVEFLKEFLPVLNARLFPPSPGGVN